MRKFKKGDLVKYDDGSIGVVISYNNEYENYKIRWVYDSCEYFTAEHVTSELNAITIIKTNIGKLFTV